MMYPKHPPQCLALCSCSMQLNVSVTWGKLNTAWQRSKSQSIFTASIGNAWNLLSISGVCHIWKSFLPLIFDLLWCTLFQSPWWQPQLNQIEYRQWKESHTCPLKTRFYIQRQAFAGGCLSIRQLMSLFCEPLVLWRWWKFWSVFGFIKLYL